MRFPTPASSRHFGRCLRVSFFNHRPPAHLRKQGSSSRALCSSPESYCRRSAQNPKIQAPPLGFAVPHRDLNHPRLTPRASLACSVPCRPRRFARPRRFPPRMALWVYFTPLPRPGLSLQGFAPRPQPTALSYDRFPLVVPPRSANGSCPPSPLHEAAPSGLSSASESGAHQRRVRSLTSPNPLLRFSSSRYSRVKL